VPLFQIQIAIALFCYPSRFVDWICGLEKEKEESEVPKVESILKEPRRESRCERG